MTGDAYVTFLPIPDNAGQAVITTRAEETGSERLSHTPKIAQQHEPSLPLRPTLSTKAGPCPRARLSLPPPSQRGLAGPREVHPSPRK